MPAFFLSTRAPPRSTLFPSPPLSRSRRHYAPSVPLECLAEESAAGRVQEPIPQDRKSTRLNSSPSSISHARFFFKHAGTTEIYSLSLPAALPISPTLRAVSAVGVPR